MMLTARTRRQRIRDAILTVPITLETEAASKVFDQPHEEIDRGRAEPQPLLVQLRP